jgi:hypothetical protein
MPAGPRCDPARYAAREKDLGLLTSVVSGTAAYLLMYLFELAGVPVADATALMSVITNGLGYVLDVMFAKQCFGDFARPESGASYRLVSSADRAAWLLRSLASFAFVRFLITIAIDVIVSRFVLRYAQSLLDQAGILTTWRWRDTALALAITFVNFNLFVNRLRFDWAYRVAPDPVMDLIMFSWFSSLVVSHIVFEKVSEAHQRQAGFASAPAAAAWEKMN